MGKSELIAWFIVYRLYAYLLAVFKCHFRMLLVPFRGEPYSKFTFGAVYHRTCTVGIFTVLRLHGCISNDIPPKMKILNSYALLQFGLKFERCKPYKAL